MADEFKDYYETLGLERKATDAEIKKAYRKLARKYHPDVAKGDDKATAMDKFKEVNEAHEVLSDPEKRKTYDQLGASWREGGSSPPPGAQRAAGPGGEQEFQFTGSGFSDFFEEYFGGGSRYGFPQDMPSGGGAQTRAYRGSDIEGEIFVTLDEAMNGSLRTISMRVMDRRTGQARDESFQVRIPAGVTDGQRIRVPEHGEEGSGGGPSGDLYLRVRHEGHPDFTTQKSDLYHELPIAPWEAVLGAEISVPSLDGAIRIKVPAGAEPGQQLRVRGRGLPKGKSGTRGDYYVILELQLPETISEEEQRLWEELRDTSNFHPRKA